MFLRDAHHPDLASPLDVLVVAADGGGADGECTDDLVTSGYRIEVEADENLRRIAATEHHAFGDTYSTTRELTDW